MNAVIILNAIQMITEGIVLTLSPAGVCAHFFLLVPDSSTKTFHFQIWRAISMSQHPTDPLNNAIVSKDLPP